MLQSKLEAYLATQPATVAVVWKDLTDGTGFSIAGDKVFPSASTIKLVIMATLLEEVAAGKRALTDTLTLTEAMLTGGDGVLKELKPGHTFTLEEILTLMIIVSDNMATNIFIHLLGMDAINAQAKKRGLTAAHLGRCMMDGEAKKQGHDNYISAEDMANLLEQIYTGKFVNAEMSALALGILKRQQQMGRLQLYLPEEVLVAHKCGDLDFLEHDGGIVLLEGRPYILVVLTCN
ncbi:MAG: serine hydrolase, partial [Pygmaiobacter sp.]